MPLIIKQGDIFTSNADYLVCPVNCEGVMGKGLAKEFKKRFPECEDIYRFNSLWFKIGSNPALAKIGDYLILSPVSFFATKKYWRDKSDLELIKKGLINFNNNYTETRYNRNLPKKSYAFPALGCGEGGLNWEDVKAIFEEVFQNCDNEIELYEPLK